MNNTNKVQLHNTYGSQTRIISDRLYNLIIGGCLLWGFFFNAVIVATLTPWVIMLNFWVVTVGYFISCLVGIKIYTASSNAAISFLGYNLIVLPIGVLLTYILYGVDPFVVFQAIATTGTVTLVMMVVSGIYPRFFLSIGRTLFLALLCVIVVELLLLFIFRINPSIIDWVVALIFCGYIGYDWARANMQEKTADNAVDGAASLYVDIINLFVRILSIMRRS